MEDVRKIADLREKLCAIRKKLKGVRRGKVQASDSQVKRWTERKKEILGTLFPKGEKKPKRG